MDNNQDLANDYFERHPSSSECFITSDGRVFHQTGTAQSYATALEDSKVETFKKAVEKIEVVGSEEVKGDVITLATFDPETTKYPEAKALLAELGLTAASLKKDDIFAALIEAKSKIQE